MEAHTHPAERSKHAQINPFDYGIFFSKLFFFTFWPLSRTPQKVLYIFVFYLPKKTFSTRADARVSRSRTRGFRGKIYQMPLKIIRNQSATFFNFVKNGLSRTISDPPNLGLYIHVLGRFTYPHLERARPPPLSHTHTPPCPTLPFRPFSLSFPHCIFPSPPPPLSFSLSKRTLRASRDTPPRVLLESERKREGKVEKEIYSERKRQRERGSI